jgi:predicted ATPase/DNA-binding SARP family transcriptional activator
VAAPLELRLLGPVEAAVDGCTLELGGPRQRALLALLALDPGRPVAADRLVEELWHGAPPAGAATTLRTYVSRLRRALGTDAVVARGGGYALARGDADAARFERLLAEGRAALARGAAGAAAERLHAALAFWRGPALADARDADALAREAHRLDELRLDCVETRVEADLALGRHAELVPELRVLVGEQPLRERLWRQLVLALYRAGRQAEALAAYREARELLDRELGLEPGEELRELERAVLRQDVDHVPPAETRHNLPAPTTSLVGRNAELAELARLLRAHRLVTVTGLGGSGKTRLALAAAGAQVEAWRGGVWLVDLTAVADPQLVAGAVADALPLADRGGDTLPERVRELELLLLLDNCEHLADACAELVASLLARCPNVRVLATSRVPLALPAEADYPLDPLPAATAAELFVERASAVRHGADWPRAEVEAICRDLDGLPLAIELAAARAKALSLADIAARLDDRFRFLRAWRRVADPRHRTLETTMDWSYDLLGSEEQRLLRALSVFAGGADLAAVEAVCAADDEPLARLVDASLVRAESGRYRLLETVRRYAAAKLDDDAVHRRHAEHYLRVAEGANLSVEAVGRGPQRPERVLAEQHNLRAALDWAAEHDVELALRLLLALENFWVVHALDEGRRRYEDVLPRADGADPALLVRSTRDYGACLDVAEEWAAARAQYERSLELARAAGDARGAATARFRLGVVGWHDSDPAYVREAWEESARAFRELGDRIGEIQAIGNLGGLEWEAGDRTRAVPMVEEALAAAREVGWTWWVARALADLTEFALADGRLDDAERHGREFLTLSAQSANRQETLFALALLARAAAARGDAGRALALFASVDALEDGPGRFGRFDRDALAAAMPSGPRPGPLPLDAAVALALA